MLAYLCSVSLRDFDAKATALHLGSVLPLYTSAPCVDLDGGFIQGIEVGKYCLGADEIFDLLECHLV